GDEAAYYPPEENYWPESEAPITPPAPQPSRWRLLSKAVVPTLLWWWNRRPAQPKARTALALGAGAVVAVGPAALVGPAAVARAGTAAALATVARMSWAGARSLAGD